MIRVRPADTDVDEEVIREEQEKLRAAVRKLVAWARS